MRDIVPAGSEMPSCGVSHGDDAILPKVTLAPVDVAKQRFLIRGSECRRRKRRFLSASARDPITQARQQKSRVDARINDAGVRAYRFARHHPSVRSLR